MDRQQRLLERQHRMAGQQQAGAGNGNGNENMPSQVASLMDLLRQQQQLLPQQQQGPTAMQVVAVGGTGGSNNNTCGCSLGLPLLVEGAGHRTLSINLGPVDRPTANEFLRQGYNSAKSWRDLDGGRTYAT